MMAHSENVTLDDESQFRAAPFKHTTACKVCGTVTMCAGNSRRDMRCIEDFAKRRHRRIGQLRSRVAREVAQGYADPSTVPAALRDRQG